MNKQLAKQSIRALARAESVDANNALTEIVTNFGSYIDTEGNRSTSMAGYRIHLNKAIKKIFGDREHLSATDLRYCVAVMSDIAQTVENGMAKHQTRKEIKEAVKQILTRAEGFFAQDMRVEK